MKRSRNKIIVLILLLAMSIATLGAAAPLVQSAIQDAASVERIQEVVALRETDSETYLLSDGSYECVIYAGDKYYRDSHNTLKLIDNTLTLDDATAKTEKRHYKNTANSFQVTFSDSEKPTVTMAKDSQGITFQAETASGGNPLHITADSKAVTVGAVRNCDTLTQLTDTGNDTITYTNAFYNTDIVYVLQNDALKEYIVLKNKSAPNAITFRFTTNGLTLDESNGVGIFLNENKEEVFRLDRLFAVDGNNEMTEELDYTFTPVKGSEDILVTVTLNEAYLTAEERVFPVVIDPSVMVSSAQTADASVYSAKPDTNYQVEKRLRTGKDTTYGKRRSYLRFSLPDVIIESNITSATLDIKKHSGVAPTIRAYQCNRYWSSKTITWNNKPDYTVVNISSEAVPRSSGSAWYQMDVTNIVSYWQDYPEDCFGFVVRDNKESDTDHWTTFYSSDAPSPNKPELHIYYIADDDVPISPGEESEPDIPEPSIPDDNEDEIYIPFVDLSLLYDNGYAERHSDAAERAQSILDAVADYYRDSFGLIISTAAPILTTSYADECSDPNGLTDTSIYTSACFCVADAYCENTEYGEEDSNNDGIADTEVLIGDAHEFHHKNVYNMLHNLNPASSKSTTKLLLTGHRTCVRTEGSSCVESELKLYGLAYFHRRTSIVSNKTDDDFEKVSAIHEFGHLLGIKDHYTSQAQDSEYDDNCIYGYNHSDYETVSSILICSGCQNDVFSAIDEHRTYFQ